MKIGFINAMLHMRTFRGISLLGNDRTRSWVGLTSNSFLLDLKAQGEGKTDESRLRPGFQLNATDYQLGGSAKSNELLWALLSPLLKWGCALGSTF